MEIVKLKNIKINYDKKLINWKKKKKIQYTLNYIKIFL
jgi:hypothetical protein